MGELHRILPQTAVCFESSCFVSSSVLEELEGPVLVSVPVSRHLLFFIKKPHEFQLLSTYHFVSAMSRTQTCHI